MALNTLRLINLRHLISTKATAKIFANIWKNFANIWTRKKNSIFPFKIAFGALILNHCFFPEWQGTSIIARIAKMYTHETCCYQNAKYTYRIYSIRSLGFYLFTDQASN